jgi:hypothetical protein
MALQESDREDLLRDATALVERIELKPHLFGWCAAMWHNAGSDSWGGEWTMANVVAGFRANGAVSIFFGSDPVYQFNSCGELRRAYCDGLLFKAAHRRLVSLRRLRQHHVVQLIRHDLTDEEQHSFFVRMQELLRSLTNELDSDRLCIVGQVPPDADVLGRVRDWLTEHDGLPIATTPRV